MYRRAFPGTNRTVRAAVAASGGGVTGLNMQWSDLPDATIIFHDSDFSSSSNSYAPYEPVAHDVADSIWHDGTDGGGLGGTAPYWELQFKDPGAGPADAEGNMTFECCRADNMPVDSAKLYVVTQTVEFSLNLIELWAGGVNGSAKIFYQRMWNAAGTGPYTEEFVNIIGVGIADYHPGMGISNDGVYMALNYGGAGDPMQADGTNVPLNFRDHPDTKIWIAFVFDFRDTIPANDRGQHMFYKIEGDPTIYKGVFRSITWDRFTGPYEDPGHGFCNPHVAVSSHSTTFWGYWDNLDGMSPDPTEYFLMHKIKSGNGKFALPSGV